jgi:hypothetical protein
MEVANTLAYCAIKLRQHYGFVMYGLRSKFVCLSKQVYLTKPEDVSLLQNLKYFCKLRIRNVL